MNVVRPDLPLLFTLPIFSLDCCDRATREAAWVYFRIEKSEWRLQGFYTLLLPHCLTHERKVLKTSQKILQYSADTSKTV